MGLDPILARIRVQASARTIRVTDHAREEMEEEAITLTVYVPVPPKWVSPTERGPDEMQYC